jgi:hypothetical protein
MDLVKTYYIFFKRTIIQNILLFFMTGMDLLGGAHPPSPGQRGCGGGGAIFMIKAKKTK